MCRRLQAWFMSKEAVKEESLSRGEPKKSIWRLAMTSARDIG